VGKTKRKHLTVYLDPDKFAQLIELATSTRIPRTVLAREAIDDLLTKYGTPKALNRKL
jgi:predicted transcriptional regulator